MGTRTGELLVDWGCGTGELTLPLCRRFKAVKAIDVSGERIDIARANAAREEISNIAWQIGKAEDLDIAEEACDLITSASAFHWMDRDLLCRRAYAGLKQGAALAVVGGAGADIWSRKVGWHEVAVECLTRYLGERSQGSGSTLPPSASTAGSSTPSASGLSKAAPKPKSHTDFMREAAFDVEQFDYPTEFSWPADSIAGYMYSITGGLPWDLGERRAEFEREFRDELVRRYPAGVVSETINFFLLIGRKR